MIVFCTMEPGPSAFWGWGVLAVRGRGEARVLVQDRCQSRAKVQRSEKVDVKRHQDQPTRDSAQQHQGTVDWYVVEGTHKQLDNSASDSDS